MKTNVLFILVALAVFALIASFGCSSG